MSLVVVGDQVFSLAHRLEVNTSRNVVYLDEDELLIWGSRLDDSMSDPEVLKPQYPAAHNLWTAGLG